jgi:predicted trehalose synthase
MLVILAAATVWGQSSTRQVTPRPKPVIATSNSDAIATAARVNAAANQHLQEMGETLDKMHALLKRMSANTSSGKDSMAKANLEMWTLMVEQLDKQYDQLQMAARQRENMEARRAALYKQADEKAAEAAKKAREGARAAATNPSATSQPEATPAPAPAQTASPASSTSPN